MFYLSPPTLHPPLRISAEDLLSIEDEIKHLRSLRAPDIQAIDDVDSSITIPISAVAQDTSFDAYIEVWPFNVPQSKTTSMVIDSGNTMLVMPDWKSFQESPTWKSDYEILGQGCEPWGCPANIVRGPINLATTVQQICTIPQCVFYACTSDNPNGSERTANFGTGCITPWDAYPTCTSAIKKFILQSPFSYLPNFTCVEFDFHASNIPVNPGKPCVYDGSIKLFQSPPPDYTYLDIVPSKHWMALKPTALSIGATQTHWPGDACGAIAMVDTGGGPVFLSDPSGYVWHDDWPHSVPNPWWTNGSDYCRSSAESLEIKLCGNTTNSFTYSIDPARFSDSYRGLTLVMCQRNEYMRGEKGMNIGGISTLANYLLIDYKNNKVGLRPK